MPGNKSNAWLHKINGLTLYKFKKLAVTQSSASFTRTELLSNAVAWREICITSHSFVCKTCKAARLY